MRPDAVAAEIAPLAHGTVVRAECRYEPGAGLVALRILAVDPPPPPPDAATLFEQHVAADRLAAASELARAVGEAWSTPALLEGVVRAHAASDRRAEAERALLRLLEARQDERIPPLATRVYRATQAAGACLSPAARRRVAEWFAVHASDYPSLEAALLADDWTLDLAPARGAALVELGRDRSALDAIVRRARALLEEDPSLRSRAAEVRALEEGMRAEAAAVGAFRDGFPVDGTTRCVPPAALRASRAFTLVPLAAPQLEGIALDTATRAFLLDVGLPDRVTPWWRLAPQKAFLGKYTLDAEARGGVRGVLRRLGRADGAAGEQFPFDVLLGPKGAVYTTTPAEIETAAITRVAPSVHAFVSLLYLIAEAERFAMGRLGAGRPSDELIAAVRDLAARLGGGGATYWEPSLWIDGT